MNLNGLIDLQEGEHSSVQDAQAAVRLYTMFRKQWEADIKNKDKKGLRVKPNANVANSAVDSGHIDDQMVPAAKPKKVSVKKESRPVYTDSD